MTTEIKAPTLPESVPDGTIATWYKKPGESAARDEMLVDIETDKVVLEVVAPADGVLKEIKKGEGDTIVSNEVLAVFEAGDIVKEDKQPSAPEVTADDTSQQTALVAQENDSSVEEVLMSPAARKMVEENAINPSQVPSTGKDGRVTKEDVVNFLKASDSKTDKVAAPESPSTPASLAPQQVLSGDRAEQRVPMTRLRA